MSEGDQEVRLTAREKAVVAGRGVLMALPYVGSALDHFITGPLTERRLKRIERTLAEVIRELGEDNAQKTVNERFVSMLESIAPSLGRALAEDKRARFRDLLLNAAKLPEDSTEWEEAELASTLLAEMETPALAILAAIARCEDATKITLASLPTSQVFCGELDYDAPGEPHHVLPYDWVVVEYWARWLRERRIIHYSSHDARGGFGGVALGDLGNFLIKWTVQDDGSARDDKPSQPVA